MNVFFGDVVQVDFGEQKGSVQGGVRPAVIIQNNIGNKYSPTTIVIPLTSEMKRLNMPVHDVIRKSDRNGLKKDSLVLGEQLRIIDKNRILYKLGELNEQEQRQVIKVYLANIPYNRGDRHGAV